MTKCTSKEQLDTIRRINGNRNWVAGRLRNAVETMRQVTHDLSVPSQLRDQFHYSIANAEALLANYQKFIKENPATAENTTPPASKPWNSKE